MGYVHIAHDCHIGNHNILSNYTGLSGHCTLDDHINLGGQNGSLSFSISARMCLPAEVL